MKSSVVTWLIHCKNHRLELKVHDAVNHITEATRHFQILIDWLWPQRVQKPAVFLSKCVRVCLLPVWKFAEMWVKRAVTHQRWIPPRENKKSLKQSSFPFVYTLVNKGKKFPDSLSSTKVLKFWIYLGTVHNYSVNAVLRFIIFTLLWFITVSKIFVCNMHICSKQKGWGNRTFLVVGVGCFLFTCCSFCNETVCWIWVLECSHGLIITISCLKG